MEENGFITAEEAEAAKKQELKIRSGADNTRVHAEYIAETVRQLVYAQYGDETYTRGLNVFTTVNAGEQEAAYKALRKGIMDYEQRQIYRGPEQFVDLPGRRQGAGGRDRRRAGRAPRQRRRDGGRGAGGQPKKIVAVRRNGERLEIIGEGLRPAQSGLSDKAPPKIKIRRGAVIRVVKTPKNTWEITQLPEVEGAFVAIDPRDGAIHALVGGFDFNKNKFNHVTQAWRQPGSALQALHLFRGAGKGLHALDHRQRRAAVLRRRRHRRPALGAEELRRQVRRPDAAAHGAGQVQEHGVDPHPAGRGHAERAGLDHPLRLRCREAPALPDDGAGRRLGHADADGHGLLRCSPTAATASIPG